MTLSRAIFPLMLAALFTHELDAIKQSEWRLLYVLRNLPDEQARWWFVAIHVPLFWVLMGLSHHANAKVQHYSRIGIASFCVVHAALHIRLRDDPLSTCTSPLSWSLILGAAVLGLLELIVNGRRHASA
jgi:hypothetical protein